MRARFLRAIGNLRESYWFVPAVMAAVALSLAVGLVYVDSHYTSDWFERVAWLQAGRPDGARSLLMAVAGSMIGVAGTTFSVTIAAVVYASGQYGPRLLSNFMADRGNQLTLGTFIATFLYSLVVVRTIRSPGEGGVGDSGFVPQLALLVAILLVFASIAVLIFFIHHVPRRIHINSVIEQIGRRLAEEIERRFPEDRPAAAMSGGVLSPPLGRHHWVKAADTGYVQIVDHRALVEVARVEDIVVQLKCQPGDFVHPRSVLAEVVSSGSCDQDILDRLCGAFALGSRRTPMQDLRFLIDELVEIAARALSPGVNDPFTARSCMDWLTAALAETAQRPDPPAAIADSDDRIRVLCCPTSFSLLVERSFGALAQYASTDMIAGLHYLRCVCDIILTCDDPVRLSVLRSRIEAFRELAEAKLQGASARSVTSRAACILDQMNDRDRLRHARYTMD